MVRFFALLRPVYVHKAQQGEFLKILNAPKLIGLNIGKTDMMTPTKSVTAVIGLTTGEVSSKKAGGYRGAS